MVVLEEYGGNTSPPQYGIDGPNKFINVVLNLSPGIGASQLFHLVGHEMVHVKQYTSGDFYEWVSQWGRGIALFIAEQEAVEWSLLRLKYINYDGAEKEFHDYLMRVLRNAVGDF